MKRNSLLRHAGTVLIVTALGPAASLSEATIVERERGPHHAVWQRVTEHTTPYGRTYSVTNSYHEIGTGKFHRRGEQWFPSVAEITILPSGFGVATQLQHKVIFAPNINTLGAVDCLMPDEPEERRIRVHVLGLAYANKRTGKAVMIASIKDSTGVLVAENQVLYPDAFDAEGGFRADIRYTVTLAGLEQDIILVDRPPDPALFDIPPADCRIEVYSEFVDSAQPTKETIILKREADARARQAMLDPDLVEEKLIFGQMRMDQGFAFRFDDNDNSIPMGKTWETREGRQLLVERADYSDLEPELARLPQVAQAGVAQNPGVAQATRLFRRATRPAVHNATFLPARPPKTHAAAPKLRPREMAQVQLPRQGLVLDYLLINGSMTNVVFRGDTTYFISDNTTLYGTTTLEAGACLKYAVGKTLQLSGPLDCQTSAFRPAYLTAKDDDSVGEVISGSTGTPTGRYASYPLRCVSSGNPYDVHDLRIRHATYGVAVFLNTIAKISHVQIGHVDRAGAWQQNCAIDWQNFLFYDVVNGFYGTSASTTNRAQNGTIHRASNFIWSTNQSPALALTNCLLIAVTNNLAFNSGSHNATNSSDAGVFQTAGYGQRYLASGSPYRDAGTTNIDSTLLSALRQMTTYPPLLLSNDITVDTTLTPQAERDTDAIDLGYHYSALDWIVGGMSITGATLTVRGGATVAMDVANTNWGIRLHSGGALVSDGDPVNLNRFARTHSVQEVPAGSGSSTAPLFADTYPAPASAAAMNLRLTDVPQIQKHYAFNQVNGQGTLDTLVLRDSQFRGGTNCLQPAAANQFMGWTNLLIENSGWFVNTNTASTLHLRNATFKSGVLNLNVASGCTWSVKDSIFDYTAVTNSGAGTLDHDYNGYLTNAMRFAGAAANDVVLATNMVNFQTGPLGAYYLPTNSLFVDAGSITNAALAGFAWHTSFSDQTVEGTTRLNVGKLWMALSNGIPIDADGDGVPYWSDADPNSAGSGLLTITIESPANGSLIE